MPARRIFLAGNFHAASYSIPNEFVQAGKSIGISTIMEISCPLIHIKNKLDVVDILFLRHNNCRNFSADYLSH
jgi:hypothetical protein